MQKRNNDAQQQFKSQILPEVIQFAVDFFVFNVAAVVLTQRRSADWTLQTPNVPVQVVDLWRNRKTIITTVLIIFTHHFTPQCQRMDKHVPSLQSRQRVVSRLKLTERKKEKKQRIIFMWKKEERDMKNVAEENCGAERLHMCCWDAEGGGEIIRGTEETWPKRLCAGMEEEVWVCELTFSR